MRLRGTLLVLVALLLEACATERMVKPEVGPTVLREPETGVITLSWRTESEADCYGYNVYRAESADGPFHRVNQEVIAGNGTTSMPHNYTYVDRTVSKGKIYYYLLKQVSMSGREDIISGVISCASSSPSDPSERGEAGQQKSD
jgi:hypothetical protein